MPSDPLQSFMVLVAAIGAWLLARVLGRVIVRTQLAEAPRIPPAAALAGAPAARPPTPQEVLLAESPTPMRLLGAGHERRTRRPSLTDARKGIVLATILGPCRAHSPDEAAHRA